MSFFQQLIQYLSQPPDSIVYHIVTLLALQATLGLAWWQARRRPDDALARRLAWAAGMILLLRLFILLALFATVDLIDAVALLPPLERAADALTAALLVWALAPHPKNQPHLGSALLLIVVIVIAFFYVSFALEWRELVESGAASGGYAGTQQAAMWDLLQMLLLALGGVLVLIARESQWSLRLAILAVLFVAHSLSLWFGDSLGPPDVGVSFWTRFGNIIAFPLLAVLAYRHNLHHLLPSSHLGRPIVEQLVHALDLSRTVATSLAPDQTLEDALSMASGLIPAKAVAIGLVSAERPQHLQIVARVIDDESDTPEQAPETLTWALKRDDWPSLALALRQNQQVELLPDGPGARQSHELHRELDLDDVGALLIEPLIVDRIEVGLLIFSAGSDSTSWSENEKNLCRALGPHLAQALYNASRYQKALAGESPDFEREKAILVAKLATMAEERDQAVDQANQLDEHLSATRGRLDVEHRRLRETTQALAFTAQRQAKLQRLQEEVDALREALSEAEMAMASVAAGEAGLSTEWVMRTVTRYSGELEEAQAQIATLEMQLFRQDGRGIEEIAARSRQLRTPLTSLGGYTDLLLERSVGAISPQQESLLRRMRVNVDGMIATVDLIDETTSQWQVALAGDEQADVRETIEAAINAIGRDLQAKALRLDLNVAGSLPALREPEERFYRIVAQALTGACLVSIPNGRLLVSAVQVASDDGSGESAGSCGFLRLSISDNSGQRSHELYALAIAAGDASQQDPSRSDIAELSAALQNATRLTAAGGGRSWLNLTAASGSTLSLLLPFLDSTTREGG